MAARDRRLTRGSVAPLAALLALPAALAACAGEDGPRFDPLNTTVTESEERELGHQFDRAVSEQLRMVDDPVVLGFLNDLGQDLVGHVEPQPFLYHFRLIVDPRLNAFAVPGGYVYLHTGTLLSAGSLDEFVGVLAHEIGHVKGRHYARMQERSAIPGLIAQIAGLAAAGATGEAGLAVAAQGANVAIQLRFSREFEAEADQYSVTLMTRAGYEPRGLARFFERLVTAKEASPLQIPPYLYSHPAVEDRIDSVLAMAERGSRARTERPAFDRAFRAAQVRLGVMLEAGRTTWVDAPGADRSRTQPLLDEAGRLAAAGDRPAAIARLRRAEALEPGDPRVPFRLGELLEAAGREEEAIAAWRRTLALDPTRALVWLQVGRAYQRAGDRHRAAWYLEQALRRFGGRGPLRAEAERRLEQLTFPVVDAAGLADGTPERGDTVVGFSRTSFGPGDERVAWWAKLTPRFADRREDVEVRWIAPDGSVVSEGPAETPRGAYATSRLEPPAWDPQRRGTWTVEALLGGDRIDRRTFEVGEGPPRLRP